MEELLASDQIARRETALDFGAGNSPYRPLAEKSFDRYISADLAGNLMADVVIAPDGTLPLESHSIDCVLSTQVLEHVPDPHAYLLEARRVLHPQGCLVLSTHGMWRYHPDPGDYWRWTIDGLRLELERAGFEALEQRGEMRLLTNSLLFFQDGVMEKLPHILRRPFCFVIQAAIGIIEKRSKPFSPDAAVFVLLARPAFGETARQDKESVV
jgi:SAM-dependent methyltransferase